MSAPVLVPAEPAALADLAVLVARAARADPGGAARLVAVPRGHEGTSGAVLAVSVSPLHGPGLPVVLGLRALALAAPVRLDTTVALAALADRLTRSVESLPVPPVPVLTAPWAGLSPPRTGWTPLPPLAPADLRALAAEGAARVGAGQDRRDAWTRPLPGPVGDAGGSTALALAADVLGFLPAPPAPPAQDAVAAPPAQDAVAAAVSGRWVRLSTRGGHVLARPPLLA